MTGSMVTALGAVLVACVALVSALLSAAKSAQATRQIEVLKADLSRTAAEETAKRNYEYDARKRLYEECEPLVMKLAESCEFAARRICALAERRKWGEYAAVRDIRSNWMLGKSSELIFTAHALLEPLALSNLLSEKLTPIDLGFDKRLSTVYELSRAAYRVHLEDHEVARIEPELTYNPVVPNWREKRAREPAVYWWQGLTKGRLDPAIEICIHRGEGRVTTYGEFEDRYLSIYDSPDDRRGKIARIVL